MSRSLYLCTLILDTSLFISAMSENPKKNYKFALVNGDSAFFEPAHTGFYQKCYDLGVTCIDFVEVQGDGCEVNIAKLTRQLRQEQVDGVLLKPYCNRFALENILLKVAEENGIKVATFDGDMPGSSRMAFVGTNQQSLGMNMARLRPKVHRCAHEPTYVCRRHSLVGLLTATGVPMLESNRLSCHCQGHWPVAHMPD